MKGGLEFNWGDFRVLQISSDYILIMKGTQFSYS